MSIKKVFALFLCAALCASPLAAAPAPDGGQFLSNPIADLVAKAGPAVVNIDTEAMVTRTMGGLPDDPIFREFFGDAFKEYTRQVPMKGAGSGFVVSADGRVLTNNHVIAGADKITVTFSDGRTFKATVIGKDPTFDLAVLKIDAKNLPVLALGDSDSARVGEWTVAIGNPLGLGVEPTVTVGVLSAKNRSIHAKDFNFDGFLQTDAAINPGNSGGPLLNSRGEVIGINTAIIPYAQGIGFAIPVNMAKQVMGDIVTYGKVRRGKLGVYIQNIDADMAKALNINATQGALVADVEEGSPAAKAGIKRGDVIISVGGKPVKDSMSLSTSIRQHMAGDKVEVEINRRGSAKKVTVTLAEVDSSILEADSNAIDNLGLKVSALTDEQRKKLELDPADGGLLVNKIANGSPASRVGLRENDVLLEANGRTLKATTDLTRAVSNKDTVVLLVLRQGRTYYVTLRTK